MPEGRNKAGQFVKGVSGNPGGMKKMDAKVKEMLTKATPDAAKLLAETVKDKDAPLKLRLKAAEIVMDRVYGKPTQPIEGGDNAINIVLASSLDVFAG